MDRLVLYTAKYLIILPVLVTLFIWIDQDGKQRKKYLALLVIGGLLSLLFSRLGSHFYVDPRPPFKDAVVPLFTPSGYNGFPSDHALLASFLAFAALKYSRPLGAFLLLLAVIIGWARVDAGVHHLLDILGSFVFTAVATVVTLWLLRFWPAEKKQAPDSLSPDKK